MISQFVDFIPDDLLWVFALAFALGLALILTLIIDGDELVFMTTFMISCGFMTWGGILEAWIFIAVLTIFTILIAFELKTKGGNNG